MFRIESLRKVAYPVIRDRRDLFAFVLTVTSLCVGIALSVDVTQQLLLAGSWEVAIRSWVVTTVLSGVLSLVASYWVGRALLELYRAKSAVETLSRTDPLTGLPNRRAFFEAAASAPVETMVLAIIDIDRFKNINDTHGHATGDEVIRSVARTMASELGPVGYVGRVGGEEFAVLSEAPVGHLYATVATFRARIAASPVTANGTVNVTISAGIARHRSGQTFDELYEEADLALYAAKAAGRNCIRLAKSTPAPDGEADIEQWRRDLLGDPPRGRRETRSA